jgi:NAD(P)-dependent dehydrogenase (short-subunit alcohol dehydrogenase family)
MQQAGTRAVVITGASTGIGAHCALTLAAEGFRVYAGVRREADGEALRAQAEPSSRDRLIPVRLEVTDSESIQQAAAFVSADLGGPCEHLGLVNNAGIVVGGPLEFLPLTSLRHQLAVNVEGPIAVTQAFMPLLRQAKQARIVMMSSIAGKSAVPFISPYCASKHALEAFSDALRVELAPFGIEVSIIEPGAIKTPIWQKSKQSVEALAQELPPEAHTYYGKAYAQVTQLSAQSEARGLPPEHVTRAVRHALTARQPRTRYVVGMDAQMRLLLGWLPDRVMDRLVRAYLGV